MPMTKAMKKAKRAMKKKYGAKRGESIYYGWEYREKHGIPHGRGKRKASKH